MKIILILLSAFLISSCATVFRGSSEDITFTSNPPGAEVRLSSGQACITPCTLDVTRKGDIEVTYTIDGYKSHKTAMPATIDGGAVAGYTTFNLVMLPIVNDVVDYNTRANFSRKPNPLHVEMIAQSSDTVNPASPIDGAEATDAPVEPAEATGDKPVDVLQTSDTTAGMTPVSQ